METVDLGIERAGPAVSKIFLNPFTKLGGGVSGGQR
jgi:hypothetical protein